MKIFSACRSGAGLMLLSLLATGCLQEPSYSVVPEIAPARLEVRRFSPANPRVQAIDTFRITIRYQDGDGDLGLNDADRRVNPYRRYTRTSSTDSTLNKFYDNFFVEPFVFNRATRQFQPLSVVGVPPTAQVPYRPGELNGAFQRLPVLTDGRKAPVRGTLTYKFNVGLGDRFAPGQTVRFEVSVADRALHVSNTIVTDSVRIAPR